ncbi:MAG: hypothetical protein E7241_00020 [Lachnospiraceae bacterium]|nr:hypothetical protein [Lachnospiraceae bacterium]
MRKEKKNKYGMEIVKSDVCTESKGYLKKEKTSDKSILSRSYVYIPLAIALSCVDAIVLYSITNISMQQSAIMGWLMALVVSIVLNVIPLIMAKYIHHIIYKTRQHAVIALSALAVAFTVVFLATVGLRFQYKEMYGEGSVEKIVNTVETNESTQEEETHDEKAMAVFWLLTLEPLGTSVMNLFLGLMGDNDIKKRIYSLQERIIELQSDKIYCEAALAEMDVDIERMMDIDQEKSQIMKERIYSLQDTLKAVARQVLAEELGDPTSISTICGEMKGIGQDTKSLPEGKEVQMENAQNDYNDIYSISA